MTHSQDSCLLCACNFVCGSASIYFRLLVSNHSFNDPNAHIHTSHKQTNNANNKSKLPFLLYIQWDSSYAINMRVEIMFILYNFIRIPLLTFQFIFYLLPVDHIVHWQLMSYEPWAVGVPYQKRTYNIYRVILDINISLLSISIKHNTKR